ncbi:ABC transporter ATP-binding protein [Kitasatospora sp. MBT63]|uniref:ABC transporter ATP-binding protein n=1 Tax=Kitasatospora sp. MBT63 TaxID=1444768 RepID=UPI00053BA98D|nr:ABC transporter ATP-binding protein [Kitasatospora sp. MBT63]
MSLPSTPPPGIEVTDLVRAYRGAAPGTRNALDGITFTVEHGRTTALLGPNGAGKTTLARILSTLLTPTSGTVRVAGFDTVREPKAVRAAIGLVLGGERGLYGRLTAEQNVRYWAAMCGLGRRETRQRTRAVLERLGLAEHRARPVETFSRGMLQRVHLARALVTGPRVLILDEPTAGMDPNAAHGFLALVRDLQEQGTTILLTTHDMHEARELGDQVLLLDQGRIAAAGSPAELLADLADRRTVTVAHAPAPALAALDHVLDGCHRTGTGGLRFTVTGTGQLAAAVRVLAETGCSGVAISDPSLGDVYRSVIPDREFSVR